MIVRFIHNADDVEQINEPLARYNAIPTVVRLLAARLHH